MLTPIIIPPLPPIDSQQLYPSLHFHCLLDPEVSGFVLLLPLTDIGETLLQALYGQPVVSLSYEHTAELLGGIALIEERN